MAVATAARVPDNTEATASTTPEVAAPTPAKTGAEPASASPPPEDTTKPVVYEFKLPEGAQRDEQYLSRLESNAKRLGLSPEQAQGLLDSDYAQRAALRKQWQEAIKSDAELSVNLDTKLEQGRAAIARLGGGELLDILNASGLGDFPPFVKFITKLGAEMGEPRSAELSDKSPAADPLRQMFKNSPGLWKTKGNS